MMLKHYKKLFLAFVALFSVFAYWLLVLKNKATLKVRLKQKPQK